MKKYKISAFQYYANMVLYVLGTSTLYSVAKDAKQDAWIAIILAGIGSMLVFCFIYYQLFRVNKTLSLIELFETTLGKILGRILLFLYLGYFCFITFFILRDVYEMVNLYVLLKTPRIVIIVVVLLLVYYTIWHGIECISRTSEIYAISTIFSILIIFVMVYFSNIMDFRRLLPILEEGIKPVIKVSLPLIVALPFGELFVFYHFFHMVEKPETLLKSTMAVYITAIILLTAITIMDLASIGVYFNMNTVFPTLKMIRLINVSEFIQRVDAVAVIIFLMGTMNKLVIYLFVTYDNLQAVFPRARSGFLIIPILSIVGLGSYLIGSNFTTYIYYGLQVVPYYINFPFEIIIPLILLFILKIKSFLQNGTKKTVPN